MNNFSFYNPVKIHFGEGSIENLRMELPQYGKNILIVYGGGSIKANGVYDSIMSILNDLDMNVFELSGVEPNPRVETARKGIEICKQHNV
ncbi:iron-containing alcohol dehydrogenase, partial [Acinetobacter baumannii]|nr:iron-containing alcohol dehydrogenase [Acinetobacter baumannii]